MSFALRLTLPEQIAEHLRTQIIRSEWKPGEKIQEEKVAEQLGVSRSPVREALRILEKDRLVVVIPRRGARVTEMTVADVNHLFDVLVELYALGARRFAEEGTEEDRARLRAVTEKLEACADRNDIPGYSDAMIEFGFIGRRGSHNPLLEQMLKELDACLRRAEYASVTVQQGSLKKNVSHFKRIARYAAQERKADKAAEAVRRLFLEEKAAVLKNIEEDLARKRKSEEAKRASGAAWKKP